MACLLAEVSVNLLELFYPPSIEKPCVAPWLSEGACATPSVALRPSMFVSDRGKQPVVINAHFRALKRKLTPSQCSGAVGVLTRYASSCLVYVG